MLLSIRSEYNILIDKIRMKTAVIKASNISIGYHKTTYGSESVLYSGLSFNLYQGELVCLLGQNGAGKSTLLRSILSQ